MPPTQPMIQAINFVENPVILTRRDHYLDVEVDSGKILKSWQRSLYSFEWLLPDGRIKDIGALPEVERPRRDAVERKLAQGGALERPVLGIGLLENVEIGSGRAIFLTLAANGVKTIPVHIPKSNRDEFRNFLV